MGVEQIPSNDLSLYDHVLDTTVMLGAIPPAYGWNGGPVSLDTYFAMARGRQSATPDEHGHAQAMPGSLPAMELTNGTRCARRWSTWWQLPNSSGRKLDEDGSQALA